MNGLRLLLFCWGIAFLLPLAAQDLTYAKKIVGELCSEEFAGRGYVKQGGLKAAKLIQKEFKLKKLQGFSADYFQPFGHPVINYPGAARCIVDGKDLVPGIDFLLDAGSPTTKGRFKLVRIDSATLDNTLQFERLKKTNLRNTFLLVDGISSLNLIHQERKSIVLKNELNAKGLAYSSQEQLTWSVALDFLPFPILQFKKGILKEPVLQLELSIEANLEFFSSQNVIGYIKGKKYPDSFLVVTAHYDHLGMFGEHTVFPGANDNASGTAMLLDLAAYYSKNQPDYSICFMAFAGEEAGLLGSLYYTENPLFPLKQIKFLLNLDLMATGDKGIMAVNGQIHPEAFDLLTTCNTIGSYLPAVQARGKAANSDHYFFSEKGVPAFFVYLMGNYHHYHDPGDTYEAVTFSKYKEAFLLLKDFLDAIQGK